MLTSVLIVILVLTSKANAGSEVSTPFPINSDRAKLLRDALGWMTFRKNGRLMNETELDPLFLQPLIRKYVTSKFYRTFVIAFEQGVLPRLTLNENETCDPSYTMEFKDPFNKSVTWHYQKKFTFDSYDNRTSQDRGFCDYRQGLICKPSTNTCQCPSAASMQPVASNSSIKRCQVREGKVCALIDIDHGNDPTHSALANNLHHLIFNLERPLSCTEGTQCRFKKEDQSTPFCYGVDEGPWYPPPPFTDSNGTTTYESWNLELGDECALGLYADPGSCKANDGSGLNPGFVCYNFGPPQVSNPSDDSGWERRTGMCFFEYGVYGLAYQRLKSPQHARPLFGMMVHPPIVPLKGKDLRDFYDKYISEVVPYFGGTGVGPSIEVNKEGGRCSVSKTQAMEQVWKYFSALGSSSIPDQTVEDIKSSMNSQLNSVIDLLSDPNLKLCKVYWEYEMFNGTVMEQPSLQCTSIYVPDMDGNDGACERHESDTQPYAKQLFEFVEFLKTGRVEQKNEEINYRKDILEDNPEPPCLPSLTPIHARSSPFHDSKDLEGAYCPIGSVCYEDLSDTHLVYDSTCHVNVKAPQVLVCHAISKSVGECEGRRLRDKITDALTKQDGKSTLKRGEPCDYNFEKAVHTPNSTQMDILNEYELLSGLEREKLCDRQNRNLECIQEGTCECIDDDCREPPVTWIPEKPEVYDDVGLADEDAVGRKWLKSTSGSGVLKTYFILFVICLIIL